MIIKLVKNDSYHSVAVRGEEIIGFDRDGGDYIIFLRGGGSIKARAGQYEYEQLMKALKEGKPND